MAFRIISPEIIKANLDYDPITGIFTWMPQVDRGDKWNAMHAHSQAGKPNSNGYLRVSIDGESWYLHRLAWTLSYGVAPIFIDHINGIRSDNRLKNLRSVEKIDNQRNMKRRSDNSSGVNGVSFHRQYGKWEAYIHFKGKKECLGFFNEKQKAIDVRLRASQCSGFHENHGRGI